MAVTMAEITKLRKISGAGMMDCKNALTEANGDIDKAMEIIRKKDRLLLQNVLTVKHLKVVCWTKKGWRICCYHRFEMRNRFVAKKR